MWLHLWTTSNSWTQLKWQNWSAKWPIRICHTSLNRSRVVFCTGPTRTKRWHRLKIHLLASQDSSRCTGWRSNARVIVRCRRAKKEPLRRHTVDSPINMLGRNLKGTGLYWTTTYEVWRWRARTLYHFCPKSKNIKQLLVHNKNYSLICLHWIDFPWALLLLKYVRVSTSLT